MGKKIGIKRGYWQFFIVLLFLLFCAIAITSAITSGCGSGDDSSSATTNNVGGASGGGGGGGGGATVPAVPTLTSVTCSLGSIGGGGGSCPCNLVGIWNSVSGATSYNIYYLIDPGSTPSPDTVKNAGIKIAGVSSGYTYTTFDPSYHSNYYVVTAVNSAGESAASNTVYATCQ